MIGHREDGDHPEHHHHRREDEVAPRAQLAHDALVQRNRLERGRPAPSRRRLPGERAKPSLKRRRHEGSGRASFRRLDQDDRRAATRRTASSTSGRQHEGASTSWLSTSRRASSGVGDLAPEASGPPSVRRASRACARAPRSRDRRRRPSPRTGRSSGKIVL